MRSVEIVDVRVWLLNEDLKVPFAVAYGSTSSATNAVVRVRLSCGKAGYGECAPSSHVTGENQSTAIKSVRKGGNLLVGENAVLHGHLVRRLEEALPGSPCARAGLEMAVLDAFLRHLRMPLYRFLGGARVTSRVVTDVTIPLGPLDEAPRSALRLFNQGIRTIKIKIGRDLKEDVERVSLIAGAVPRCALYLDANQGYDAGEALSLLRELSRRGIRPALFEQPVPRDDWKGLKEISGRGNVPVCADESVATRSDAERMVKARAAQVVNIKIMKSGLFQALEIAAICHSAGLKLMIGGMVESGLAMTCSAHIAAGLGWFDYIDLDTPFFFVKNPMKGVPLRRNGVYDLRKVRAGIGVKPFGCARGVSRRVFGL